MAKKSVSQEMMEECRPTDLEYKCVFCATRAPHLFSVLVVWFWYHLGFITDTNEGLPERKTEPELMHRVDKTHFPTKYAAKAFLEAEFGRRLLAKQMAKEAMS